MESELEAYAQWLDELQAKDPQTYERCIAMMQQQVAEAATTDAAASGDVKKNSAASVLDAVKQAATQADTSSGEFKPMFPGNKVMEQEGLAAKQEGMWIEVEPGFVMKTQDLANAKKVFVNVCTAEAIQTFSQRTQLDGEGKEQEGIHVPLSLGAPHEVVDKSGKAALAFDVAVNPQVVADCTADKTGSFRNFVCELAIEYIDQKYKIKLDARFKLPKLTYRGTLPPPRHFIRKTQKPIIEEVSKAQHTASSKPAITPAPSKSKPQACTAQPVCEFFELFDRPTQPHERKRCTRIASVLPQGTAISPSILQQAGDKLEICVQFEVAVTDASDVNLELRPELAIIKAARHHDLNVFLPYPILPDTAEVLLDCTANRLQITAAINKAWQAIEADMGSAQWLLTQALRGEGDEKDDQVVAEEAEQTSLVDMFHLAMPSNSSATITSDPQPATAMRCDPVDDDEELPEDRFHRTDAMSMHILEQRKAERQQRAQEAEQKRRSKRAEVEAKQRKAKEAGKTWHEMYPNEPETTYIDMADLLQPSPEKADAPQGKVMQESSAVASESARQAVAAWAQEQQRHGLDLQSALAFDLLD